MDNEDGDGEDGASGVGVGAGAAVLDEVIMLVMANPMLMMAMVLAR